VRPAMARRFLHSAGLAALAAAIVASAAPASAAPAATSASAAPAPASAVPAARTAAESTRPVLLINGERVMFRPGPAGRLVAVMAAQGGFALLFTSTVCGQAADVPATAMPFIGRGLDPSLFMVAALQRQETNGRLPVRLTYDGRRAPSVPGVTITSAARGAADGYLTPRSARKFGAALQRQYLADHARASYGTDGLFARGLSIALAGTPAPNPVRPQFVMRTLTVKGRNLAGHPDNGDNVLVFNADNCARFGDPIETDNVFDHGIAKFSVPAGHYWAIGQFLRFAGGGLRLHLAVLPQFTVSGNTTVQVAGRSATSKITFATPRPAVGKQTTFTLIRGGQAGSATGIGWAGINTQFWVNPTSSKPTVGTLQAFTSAELTSRPGGGVPYAYNLDFPGPAGLIPAQHFVVQPASLATISERYYQDLPSTGSWTTVGSTATQSSGAMLFIFVPLKLPGRQIQYMSGNPAVLWSSQYWEYTNREGDLFAGQADSFRSLHAGEHLTEDWNRYPLHPQPNVSRTGSSAFPTLSSAGRHGNLLALGTTPFSDNELGHLGTGFFTGFFGRSDAKLSGRFEISQNGSRLAAGNAVKGIPPVRLSPHPSVIRFALTAARTGRRYVLSPGSSTVWTWRSRRDTAATVPPGWFCIGSSAGITRQCAVQPMMTLRYQVSGLALDGSAPPGRQAIGINVGHIQLARTVPVTGARVQVSFNDGRTWQATPVTAAGGGRFRAVFNAPAGAFVTLRVTATDAAGGSIRETILRAYTIAS
jgi:hypothetical protein